MKAFPFLVLVSLTSSVSLGQGHVLSKTLTDDGVERSYIVYVPSGYSAEHPVPLVLAFHGMGGTAEQMMVTTGMNVVAEKEQFLVAYPDAKGGWRKGNGLDIDFADAVFEAIESDYKLDSSRIYATGFSQGGVLSYVLAVSRPGRFAAIASVGGTRPGPESAKLYPFSVKAVPNRPLPLLHMHGTSDRILLYDGGIVPIPGLGDIRFPSTPAVIADWAMNNGSNTLGPEKVLEDICTSDGSSGSSSTVSVFEYQDCDTYIGVSGKKIAAEVVHYRINGGGHSWPVMESDRKASFAALNKIYGEKLHAFAGAVNSDISASTQIWNFFKRHELPASPKPSGK